MNTVCEIEGGPQVVLEVLPVVEPIEHRAGPVAARPAADLVDIDGDGLAR